MKKLLTLMLMLILLPLTLKGEVLMGRVTTIPIEFQGLWKWTHLSSDGKVWEPIPQGQFWTVRIYGNAIIAKGTKGSETANVTLNVTEGWFMKEDPPEGYRGIWLKKSPHLTIDFSELSEEGYPLHWNMFFLDPNYQTTLEIKIYQSVNLETRKSELTGAVRFKKLK